MHTNNKSRLNDLSYPSKFEGNATGNIPINTYLGVILDIQFRQLVGCMVYIVACHLDIDIDSRLEILLSQMLIARQSQ